MGLLSKTSRILRRIIIPTSVIIIIIANIFSLIYILKEIKQIKQGLSLNEASEGSSEKTYKFGKQAWIFSEIHELHYKHLINSFGSHGWSVRLTNPNDRLPENEWSVLFTHFYPFSKIGTYFTNLRHPHCINHFPGSYGMTHKLSLSTSHHDFMPISFQLPSERRKLSEYAKKNKDAMFVEKSPRHGGVHIRNITNMTGEGVFVQEFVQNSMLIDGRKFDIGVYVVITSVKPLRLYIFDGEVNFRFCSENYHPFDANIQQKYIVGDYFVPMWQIPSLKKYYALQKLGMKGSFDAWMISQNKDPRIIWSKIEKIIRNLFLHNEQNIIDAKTPYPSHLRFFELLRLDFIVTDKLRVYLMEVNMSPNLSSHYMKEFRTMFDQVTYNLLSLIGINNQLCSSGMNSEEEEMMVATKDIIAFPEYCGQHCSLRSDCKNERCEMCTSCMSPVDEKVLKEAYLEHVWKGSFRRIFPIPPKSAHYTNISELSKENARLLEWYNGKCAISETFCY